MLVKGHSHGYQLCYRLKGRGRLHRYLVTNTYDLAAWHIELFKKRPEHHWKTHKLIREPTWHILPLTKKQAKKAWKNCPF